METPIALHSVGSVARQIPAESEMSRPNRAAHPPQIKVSHLSPDPPRRTFLSHSQQAGGQEGGVLRRAGGGYRGTVGFRKRIALQGGVAATVTPVALLCATKSWPCGQRAPKPTTEFAQPRLSRVKGRSGTNLGVFVPIWPVITQASS